MPAPPQSPPGLPVPLEPPPAIPPPSPPLLPLDPAVPAHPWVSPPPLTFQSAFSVSQTLVIAGALDEFDVNEFRVSFSQATGIPEPQLSIRVSSASVRVEIAVLSQNETDVTEATAALQMLTAHTAESLSSLMNITVQALDPPELISVLLRPPLLPPSLPSPPESPSPPLPPPLPRVPPDIANVIDEDQSITGAAHLSLVVAFGALGILLVILVPTLACIWLHRRRTRLDKLPDTQLDGASANPDELSAQSSTALHTSSLELKAIPPMMDMDGTYRTPFRLHTHGGPVLRRHQSPIETPQTIKLDFKKTPDSLVGGLEGAALRRVQERVERARVRRRNVMERVERARARRRENEGPYGAGLDSSPSPSRLSGASPLALRSTPGRPLARTHAYFPIVRADPPPAGSAERPRAVPPSSSTSTSPSEQKMTPLQQLSGRLLFRTPSLSLQRQGGLNTDFRLDFDPTSACTSSKCLERSNGTSTSQAPAMVLTAPEAPHTALSWLQEQEKAAHDMRSPGQEEELDGEDLRF